MKNTFKRIACSIAAIVLVSFISCKDEASVDRVNSTTNAAPENPGEQTTAQVNPAHGLPGHRCDLPVGAPLSSSPTTNNATPAPVPSSSVSPIRIDQSPKINPPHGEPGHDCAVPVGAELKKQ